MVGGGRGRERNVFPLPAELLSCELALAWNSSIST